MKLPSHIKIGYLISTILTNNSRLNIGNIHGVINLSASIQM